MAGAPFIWFGDGDDGIVSQWFPLTPSSAKQAASMPTDEKILAASRFHQPAHRQGSEETACRN